MIFNRYYEWYNNHRKHGALGRKSPEQYLRDNNLIYGPYIIKKKSEIVSNFNPILSKNYGFDTGNQTCSETLELEAKKNT
jgi:hypothetical protein